MSGKVLILYIGRIIKSVICNCDRDSHGWSPPMIMVFSSSSKTCLKRFKTCSVVISVSYFYETKLYRENIIMYDSCRYFGSSNTANISSCHLMCKNQWLLHSIIVTGNWQFVSLCHFNNIQL